MRQSNVNLSICQCQLERQSILIIFLLFPLGSHEGVSIANDPDEIDKQRGGEFVAERLRSRVSRRFLVARSQEEQLRKPVDINADVDVLHEQCEKWNVKNAKG